jgi:hypothetical protein
MPVTASAEAEDGEAVARRPGREPGRRSAYELCGLLIGDRALLTCYFRTGRTTRYTGPVREQALNGNGISLDLV